MRKRVRRIHLGELNRRDAALIASVTAAAASDAPHTPVPQPRDDGPPRLREITSAGILPFAVFRRRVYFLLGKEGYEPHYGDSDKWCAFGGKVEPGETLEQAAVREFYQETAGCLLDLHEARERLRRQNYLFASDYHAHRTSSRTYFMLVPFRDYPAMFRRTKHFLQYVHADIGCIEKSHLHWFPLNEVRDIVLDRWGPNRYARKPKFRSKFAGQLRAVFADVPDLERRCLVAYAQQK